MPPTFIYLLVLMAYIGVALVVWCAAAVLAVSRQARPLARRIAAGMAGSFPGVFAFQILAAPAVGLLLVFIHCTFGTRELTNTWEIVLVLAMLAICLSVVTIMSCLGFYVSWRMAWELAAGRSVRTLLVEDRLLGPIVRLLRRRIPFLQRMQ